MPLNVDQMGALLQARQIVDDAGILDLTGSVSDNPKVAHLRNILDSHLPAISHPLVDLSKYSPALASPFSEQDIQASGNRVTWQKRAHVIVMHPAGAVVGFPQSGSYPRETIAHRFSVDINQYFVNPKENIQYLLGDGNGGHANVTCYLLCDSEIQKPVSCYQLKTTCWGIKHCSFNGETHLGKCLNITLAPLPSSATSHASGEHGCLFEANTDTSGPSELETHTTTSEYEDMSREFFERDTQPSWDLYEGL
ncbi:hypothetical protein K439DRAFT_1611498 [Ramaria rubella]|nr:hypothetical protein K439DRAFT_1611498 [Ramaria rubella]